MRELLDAIIAAPEDDAPRRVYADALLETGEALGELIHIQLDLETGGLSRADAIARRRRESELFREHGTRWIEPLRPMITERTMPTFRRGFIDELSITADAFAEHAVFEKAPLLRGVVLEDVQPIAEDAVDVVRRFEAALAQPELERLHGLHCKIARYEDEGGYEPDLRFRSVARDALPVFLAAVPRMRSLRTLAMFDPEEARPLVNSGLLAQIERLDLGAFKFETVKAVLDATPPLRSLVLPPLERDPLVEILAHPALARLDELSIYATGGPGKKVAAALDRADFPELRRFEIHHADSYVMKVLGSSPRFAKLVELDFGVSSIDLTQLANATRLDALRIVRARQRFMVRGQLEALVACPIMKQLELVDLRLNHVAHTLRERLREQLDCVLLVSETWGGWFEESLYGWNVRAHYTD